MCDNAETKWVELWKSKISELIKTAFELIPICFCLVLSIILNLFQMWEEILCPING